MVSKKDLDVLNSVFLLKEGVVFLKKNMQEESEIINFILSVILFIYYIYLLKGTDLKAHVFWKYAMFCIILSNATTILEAYFYFETLDYMEHGFYIVAGLLFFIGAFRLKAF